MARFGGGHEDLNEERKLLAQLEGGLDSLTAKEKVARKEVETTDEAIDRSISKRERLKQIQREQRQVQERAAQVENVEAKAIDQSTVAIERNAAARERAARAAVNTNRALAGARDPLLGRAHALGQEGLPPSQYQMRRELGVGSARAQRLQEAISAGYRPAPTSGGPQHGPLAGQEALNQANIELAAARRAAKRATTKGDLAALNEATAAEEQALARREAAKAQLKSASSAQREARALDEQAARTAGIGPSVALQRRQEFIPGALGGGRVFGQGETVPGPRGPFNANPRLTGVDVRGEERGRPPVYSEDKAHEAALQRESALARAAAINEKALADARRAAISSLNVGLTERAGEAMAHNANQTDRVTRATRFSSVEYGTANQQIRQHGTLTSEFIQAAMRGETTLRELGNQALVTAGKFGAWTGAATAIFGAVAAVHKLGEGAIQSSSGVNQLRRVVNDVNGDQLQQQFSDLAGEFNVPIEVAADAVYRMGQVFHNQTDAVEAARSALYSYKTGEVDVASSTQNLIAIVNGFGLTAKDLSGVYDQINQAQNKFGIRIADTEQGLAKAAGTYRNAGGDLDYLLAVFVAIQKATGRSGTEIGTGIARGVNEIRKPINQARLKAQGVDVDPENFQKTLQSGLAAARKSGADLQQIASGLFGNQYARLISPVLADQTRLNKALGDTSPEKSKGSAQQELAKVLGQVDEQITKIGVNLQRLGAGLAQAGLGDIPYLLLRGLNLTLDTATKLVDIFDKLPAPLRHALTLFAQIAVVMRVIRRFGGLPGIAEKVPGAQFLAAPDQRVKNLAVAGARQSVDAADKDVEAATLSARKAHGRAAVLAKQAEEENARYAGLTRSGKLPPLDSPERTRLEHQRLVINTASKEAEDAALRAQIDANTARELSLVEARRKTELEAMSAAEVRRQVELERAALPASFNVPERRGALIAGQRALSPTTGLARDLEVAGMAAAARTPVALKSTERGLGHDLAALAPGYEAATVGAAETTRQLNRVERAILPYTAGLRTYGDALRQSGPVTRLAGRGAGLAANAADRAAAGVAGATGALRSMGSGMVGLLRSFGPLEYALIGFFAFEGISSVADGLKNEQEHALRAIEKFPSSAAEIQARNRAIQRALHRSQASGDVGQALGNIAAVGQGHIRPILSQTAENAKYLAAGFKDVVTLDVFSPDYESAKQRDDRIKREAELGKEEQDRIKRLQSSARRRGTPIPLQTLDVVRDAMRRDAKLREQGIISLAEFDKRMADHMVEAKTAQGITAKGATRTAQLQAELKRSAAPDLYHRYAGAPADEIRQRIQNLAADIGTGDAGPRAIREYGYAYRRLVDKIGNSDDPKTVAQFMSDRDAFFKGLEDGANATLQNALAAATTERQRRAAFSQAGRSLAAIPQADRTQLSADEARLASAGQEFSADRAKRGALRIAQGALGPLGGGKIRELAQKLDRDLARDRGDIAKWQKSIQEDRKRLHDAIVKSNRLQRANDEAAFQDRQQGRDIDLALQQSRTRDPLKQARLAEDSARRGLADARKNGTSRDRKQAQQKINQAEEQADQALLARAQALDSVREAQVALATGNDPTAVANAALQSARNTLSILKQQGADPTQIATAYAQVLQAEVSTAQTARDEAQAIAAIQFQLAAARAGGGAEATARAAQQIARYNLAHAKNKKDRLQALLDLANANNQAEQAAVDAESARYEYLAALTDDPVEKARYKVQDDKNRLKHARGGTERNRARAQLKDDQRAAQDAQLQAREGDIDFNLEMERISRQQAIDQYRSLLQAHNLTKEQRRDILRKVKQLQDEANQEATGFGLQVGQGVKVPTIYDIRRAISSARRATDQGTTYNAKTNVNVNVEVNDPDAAGKVFDAIDDALSTSVRSTVRSAGMSL